MKKYIISITMALACALMLSNCSESSFEDKYRDPSKTSDIELPRLMSGSLMYSNDWIMSTYGRFFGWEIQVLCKQANTIGVTLENGTYYHLEGYTEGLPPYGHLMRMIANYKLMENLYNDLPDAEKKENEAYLLAVETMMYGMTAYIMSSFGDIPFDEVGAVTMTGDAADAHPSYQDDKELYKRVLDKLGELNTKFTTVQKPSLFSGQDYICKGDLLQWRRLANSLRLRTALLVSTNGDLATEGQRVIKEILGDPAGYPIIENNDQMILYKQVEKSGSSLDINGGSGFDWVNLKTASSEIIKRMQKAGDGGVWEEGKDDPRVPIFFCLATKNGEFPVLKEHPEQEEVGEPLKAGKAIPTVFRGASASMDYDEWNEYFLPSDNRAYFSRIREHGFFRNNRNWDNPVLTAAEISFIKAEAYQRGWATGDPKAAFKEGIKQSIQFYIKRHKEKSTDEETSISASVTDRGNIHARSVINPNLELYDDAWIEAFAEDRWVQRVDGTTYSGGALEAIMEQKWLNFGYVYAGEQWNDLRRTGYPRMLYPRDHDPMAEIPYARNRNKYPNSDRDNNLKFNQVEKQNNYSDVLFWAIKDWHDGPTW